MALSDEILADLKAKKAGGDKPMPMKGGPPAPADNGAEEGAEYASDEEAIAGDIMTAFKSGDSGALAEGLKAFIDVCRPQGLPE